MTIPSVDTSRLPKWARELFEAKEREIKRLNSALATLRNESAIDNAVGQLLQSGYLDEPIPLGPYFRVKVGELEICNQQGQLTIRCDHGSPAILPGVSNVIFVRHLP